MKRVVKYNAIDPYYSDFDITFIGADLDSLDYQQYELENYLGREHCNGIGSIYRPEIIEER